jgi:hypothetical protein
VRLQFDHGKKLESTEQIVARMRRVPVATWHRIKTFVAVFFLFTFLVLWW